MSDGYIGDTALRAPDLVEAVVGVRGFARSGHSLASPFQGDEWRRPEQRASCSPDRSRTAAALAGLGTKPKQAQSVAARIVARQERLRQHAAPDNECSCGLYAYHEPDAAHLDLHPIVGVVEAWGALCVHATGFRAARVKVVALALRDDLDPAAVADQRCAAGVGLVEAAAAALRRACRVLPRIRLTSARRTPPQGRRGGRRMTLPGPSNPIIVEPLPLPKPEPLPEPAPAPAPEPAPQPERVPEKVPRVNTAP